MHALNRDLKVAVRCRLIHEAKQIHFEIHAMNVPRDLKVAVRCRLIHEAKQIHFRDACDECSSRLESCGTVPPHS